MPTNYTFNFSTVPHIVSAPGAAAELGTHIASRFPRVRRALVVTDPGFLRTGLVDAPLLDLHHKNISTVVFSEVVADPPESVVLDAVAFAREKGVDIVIGLGGGSSMDVAKLIAVLAPSDQPIQQIYGIGNVTGHRLPLVQIPTTAGTGSEVTQIAIVTTGATTKMGVVAPQLFADLAILDAQLTLGLPPMVTAATGIDAMVHAIEAYTSKHRKNPMSDQLARQALALLSANVRTVCADGSNLEARSQMLLGSMLAGMAFANSPVAAVHALAYPIGALFHVPHGLSNALVLTQVLRFNLPEAEGLYAELAPIVDPKSEGMSVSQRARLFVDAIAAICRDCNVPASLADVGIARGDLKKLAEDAMKQTRLLVNNPRELSFDDALAIYTEAFGNRAAA
jgi:alcohol dehydrogenase class IV